MRFARLTLIVLAATGMTSARGADAPRPAPPPDAISAARKDLLEMKKDAANPLPPGPGLGGSLNLPAVPSIGASAVTVPALRPTDEEGVLSGAKKAPSRGWLVDAMAKEEARDRLPAEQQEIEKREELLNPGSTEPNSAATLNLAEAVEARRLEEERAKAESTSVARRPVVNPLDGFMADWLGKSNLEVWNRIPNAAASAGESAATVPALGATTPNAVTGAPAFQPPAAAFPAPSGPPASNPFLAGLAPPPASLQPSGSPAVAPKAAPVSMPTVVATPRPVVAPATSSPAPARTISPPPSPRGDDQKYFPQLKRF